MINNIYLDLDGPLCEFVEAALVLHGKEHVLENWPRGEYDICKVTGLGSVAFWDRIAAYSPGFWVDLKPCPWANALVDICRKIAPITIATEPSLNIGSACGKLKWLQNFFGRRQSHRWRGRVIPAAVEFTPRFGCRRVDQQSAGRYSPTNGFRVVLKGSALCHKPMSCLDSAFRPTK